jgi:hypothetical protein
MNVVPRPLSRPLAWGLLTLAALLAGCSGPLRVDNQVRSFAQWASDGTPSGPATTANLPLAPQVFRFDRLPSQAEGSELGAQQRLEALAASELRAFGWQVADPAATAPWRVQVTASTQRLARAPWEDPWDGYRGQFHAGIGLGGYRSGVGGLLWIPVLPPPSSPYFLREVALVIRETASGRVVYETRASHDGRWNSTPDLWTAMLRAALQGFPNPPAGPRRVDIEIERSPR